MHIEIDKEYVLRTLTRLVKANSINPLLVAGAPGEKELAGQIAAELTKMGLDVNILSSAPGRDSVIGVLKGMGGSKSLMFNAHIDTVGIEGMEHPFSADMRDGKLYGRGAFDMKGAMAACMAAMKALTDASVSLKGDVVIAGVADEEYTSIGTQDVIKHARVDAAIVTEPTQLQICLAHKGFVWLEVETRGRAAHGSRFEEGIDANMHMGRFLARLDRLEKKLRKSRPHPLVGLPSLHAAMLHGGVALSTYADRCRLAIERRTVPGETLETVLEPIEQIIAALSEEDVNFHATVRATTVRDPFEVPLETPIVQTLAATAAGVLGKAPAFIGDAPWMDSALLANAGVETVVMGPAGSGAHAAEEWVDIASVEKLAEILAKTALQYCA